MEVGLGVAERSRVVGREKMVAEGRGCFGSVANVHTTDTAAVPPTEGIDMIHLPTAGSKCWVKAMVAPMAAADTDCEVSDTRTARGRTGCSCSCSYSRSDWYRMEGKDSSHWSLEG